MRFEKGMMFSFPSLRGAERRGNPALLTAGEDWIASLALAMTKSGIPPLYLTRSKSHTPPIFRGGPVQPAEMDLMPVYHP